MRRVIWMLLVFVIAAVPVQAQEEDAEGSRDHPLLTRMPGYYISGYDEQEFGAYDFKTNGQEAVQRVEGHYWEIGYHLREGASKAGPLQVLRNYLNAFTARGGVRVHEQSDTDYAELTATLPLPGKSLWLGLEVYDRGNSYRMLVVEQTTMEQKVELTAPELLRALQQSGSVTLYGILFDTGKATIKAESAATLLAVADALKADPALRIAVHGHTDNVGAAPANQALSQQRADAVRSHLVHERGIAADRLSTAGFGASKPVADNATEEGRARNRRVELVRQ